MRYAHMKANSPHQTVFGLQYAIAPVHEFSHQRTNGAILALPLRHNRSYIAFINGLISDHTTKPDTVSHEFPADQF